MKKLRKQIADEQGVPPYVVFSDATLQEMAQEQPTTRMAMLAVSGVGMKKFETYGEVFIQAIVQHGPPRNVPADGDELAFGAPTARPKAEKAAPKAPADPTAVNDSEDATFQLHRQGLNPLQIAEQRGLAESTVKAHLERAYTKGLPLRLEEFVTDTQLAEIAAARTQLGGAPALRDLFDHLREKYDYFQLRLASIRLRK